MPDQNVVMNVAVHELFPTLAGLIDILYPFRETQAN